MRALVDAQADDTQRSAFCVSHTCTLVPYSCSWRAAWSAVLYSAAADATITARQEIFIVAAQTKWHNKLSVHVRVPVPGVSVCARRSEKQGRGGLVGKRVQGRRPWCVVRGAQADETAHATWKRLEKYQGGSTFWGWAPKILTVPMFCAVIHHPSPASACVWLTADLPQARFTDSTFVRQQQQRCGAPSTAHALSCCVYSSPAHLSTALALCLTTFA